MLMFGLAHFKVADSKGIPIAGATIVVKSVDWSGKPVTHTVTTDETGNAVVKVTQTQMPTFREDAGYEVTTAKGIHHNGSVQVGGNLPIYPQEVTLNAA